MGVVYEAHNLGRRRPVASGRLDTRMGVWAGRKEGVLEISTCRLGLEHRPDTQRDTRVYLGHVTYSDPGVQRGQVKAVHRVPDT